MSAVMSGLSPHALRASRKPTLRSRFLNGLAEPVRLILIVWLLHAALFLFGPNEYTRSIAPATWLWTAAGLSMFILGHAIAARLPVQPPLLDVPAERVSRVILWTGLIGLTGILMLATDKILYSGLDYSKNMAALRFERDAQVYLGVDVNRSPLLYLAYPTFSLAYASLLLFILDAERIKGRYAVVGQLSILSPVLYAYLYGSRGNLLLLLYLLAGALAVRRLRGKYAIPRVHGVRWKLVAFVLAFLAYSNFTWQDRRAYSSADMYDRFGTLTSSWGMRPRPWMDELVANEWISGETAMNISSSAHYYGHSFVSLDRIREYSEELRPFGGFFQIGILSPISRLVAPEWEHVDDMRQQLRSADLLGFYVTALGASYLDFGLIGAALVLSLWGMLCGWCYRMAAVSGSLGAQLFLCAVVCSILISPMNSPVGMSNSFLILAGLWIAVRSLRHRRRRAALPVTTMSAPAASVAWRRAS